MKYVLRSRDVDFMSVSVDFLVHSPPEVVGAGPMRGSAGGRADAGKPIRARVAVDVETSPPALLRRDRKLRELTVARVRADRANEIGAEMDRDDEDLGAHDNPSRWNPEEAGMGIL